AGIPIDMLGKIGVVFHEARRAQSFVVTKLVPCFYTLRAWCEFGVTGHSTGFLLLLKRLFTKLVPAFVKLTFMASAKARGNLMRSMGRSICNVGEKRSVR